MYLFIILAQLYAYHSDADLRFVCDVKYNGILADEDLFAVLCCEMQTESHWGLQTFISMYVSQYKYYDANGLTNIYCIIIFSEN